MASHLQLISIWSQSNSRSLPQPTQKHLLFSQFYKFDVVVVESHSQTIEQGFTNHARYCMRLSIVLKFGSKWLHYFSKYDLCLKGALMEKDNQLSF